MMLAPNMSLVFLTKISQLCQRIDEPMKAPVPFYLHIQVFDEHTRYICSPFPSFSATRLLRKDDHLDEDGDTATARLLHRGFGAAFRNCPFAARPKKTPGATHPYRNGIY